MRIYLQQFASGQIFNISSILLQSLRVHCIYKHVLLITHFEYIYMYKFFQFCQLILIDENLFQAWLVVTSKFNSIYF